MSVYEHRGVDFTYNQLIKNELEKNVKAFAELDDYGHKVKRSKNMEVLPKSALFGLASNVFYERVHRHIKDNATFGFQHKYLKKQLGSKYNTIIEILFERDDDYKSYIEWDGASSKKTYTKRYRLKPLVDELFRKTSFEYFGKHTLLDRYGRIVTDDGFLVENSIRTYSIIDNERSKSIKSAAVKKSIQIPTLVPINMDHLYWSLKAYGSLKNISNGVMVNDETKAILKSSGVDFGRLKPKDTNSKITADKWFKTVCGLNTITHTDPIPYGNIVQKYNEIGNGRLYTEGAFGIQNWPKHIRSILLSGMGYYDYDFANCHWNILEQLNDHYGGKKLEVVSEYNSDVSNVRRQIAYDCGVPIEVAKQLMISVVYGSSLSKKRTIDFNKSTASKKIYGPSAVWDGCLKVANGDEASANRIWENVTNNVMIRDLNVEVKKAQRVILRNAMKKGKGQREYIRNHYDRWMSLHKKVKGGYVKRPNASILSHMLCGVEALMLSEVVLAMDKDDNASFSVNFHDGWICSGGINKREYENTIYKATQQRLTEYDGKLADRGIRMSIVGGSLKDPFKANKIKPKVNRPKEKELPSFVYLPN